MTEPHWTWEQLRDFFAGGGKISLPTAEDLMRDGRPGRIKLETLPVSEDDWVRKAIEGLHDKMAYEGGVLGVDLAQGRSETWEMRYDWETGKMIYRKLDPADMVRRDEEGEGSPDNGSD